MVVYLLLFGLGMGDKMGDKRVFTKYRKNGLADLHQTFSLLSPLYRPSFECRSIGHLFLPW